MKNLLLIGMVVVALAACNKNVKKEETSSEVIVSEKQSFMVDTLTDQLNTPWGIAFLPDGRILVTELSGEIRIVKDGKLLDEKISNVPAVSAGGQGGLLDIKLHPDY